MLRSFARVYATATIGRITNHTFSAMIVWPLMLSADVTRVERFVRGKDPDLQLKYQKKFAGIVYKHTQ